MLKYIAKTCQTKSVVYQSRLIETISRKVYLYLGMTGGTFKARYGNHKHSIENYAKRGATTLSEQIWSLNAQNIEWKIEWRFVSQVDSYTPKIGKCKLCLEEKYLIIYRPETATLNQRSELASHCLHRDKFLLSKS